MDARRRRQLALACSLLLLTANAADVRGQGTLLRGLDFLGGASEPHVDIPPQPDQLKEFQKKVLLQQFERWSAHPQEALKNDDLKNQLDALLKSDAWKQLPLDPAQRKQLEFAKSLVDRAGEEPDKLAGFRENAARILGQMKPDDPAWQERVKKITNWTPPGRSTPPEHEQPGSGREQDPPTGPAESDGGREGATKDGEAGEFDRWLLRQTDRLGRWTEQHGNSPALQHALRAARLGMSDGHWNEQRRSAGESYLANQLFRLGRRLHAEELLEKLNFSVKPRRGASSFGGGRLPGLGVPWGGLPSFGLPQFSMPTGGGPDSGSSLIWLVIAAVSAQVLWFVYHKRKQSRAALARAEAQKSWPVTPSSVASREDLIKAFEFLSVSKLGLESRTWNHLDIAAALGEPGRQQRDAADRLAAIYEQARYAPEVDPLPDDSLADARRALSLLAGVSPA